MSDQDLIRLNKFLASCGLGGRRDCDAMIASGEVTVDGEIASVGQKISSGSVVHYRGELVQAPKTAEYYAYHKPRGAIVSARDPYNPFTIYDDLSEKGLCAEHLKYVGRLDKDSEGLLLLTNDGKLAHSLTHPRFEIKKVYMAGLPVKLPDSALDQMVERGVFSKDQLLFAHSARYVEESEGLHWYEVVLYEGKNRQVRRLFEGVGQPLERLVRLQFATIKLRDLAYGEFRKLSDREIKGLHTKIATSIK